MDEEQGWVPSSYLDLPYGGMDVAVNRAVTGKGKNLEYCLSSIFLPYSGKVVTGQL